MSEYKSLIATINANIRRNGNQEITGQVLNGVLNAMVGELGANYQFAGVADRNTDPGIPDAKVFYIPTESGTYPNFGGLVVPKNKVYFFVWDGAWIALDTHMCEQMQEAEEAREIAEVARATAEAQRVLNENQRIANELIRQQGEETRNTRYEAAEAQRDAEYAEAEAERNEEFTQAEAVRNAGEQTRISNETARQTAEAARQTAEALRVSKESARIAAETEREEKEAERETAEAERETAEAARATAENNRISKENSRVAHENSRISAEAGRVEAEAERKEAEAAREEAEVARQTTFEANEERREEAYQEAIDNLGDEVVRTTPQSLTDSQKAQARVNIGVGEDGVSDMNTLASQLTSLPTEQSIVSRTSPTTSDGLAKVKSIKGNSVVWNQLVKNSIFKQDVAGWSYNDTSFDGTESDGSSIISEFSRYSASSIRQPLNIAVGHKVLCYAEVKSKENYTQSIGIGHTYTRQYYALNTASYTTIWTIVEQQSSGNYNDIAIGYGAADSKTYKYAIKYALAIDLTQMFGSGNEPSTYAEFLVRKPKVEDEFAYNAGTIVNNKVTSIEVGGRNLCDEEFEVGTINNTTGGDEEDANNIRTKGYVAVLPNQQYFLKSKIGNYGIRYYWYDSLFHFISGDLLNNVGGVITSPSNAVYLRLRTTGTYGSKYLHDIMLNIGTTALPYEPHHTASFDCDWKKVGETKDVVWNQLAKGETIGVFTRVSDSVVSYNFSGSSQFYRAPFGTFMAISGHKYLVHIKNSTNVLRTSNYGIIPWVSGDNIKSGVDNIYTASQTIESAINLTNDTTATASGQIEAFVIDLTQMFGAGNEPTTIADFNKWQIDVDKTAYNAGVKKEAFNPLFPNGGCSAGSAYDALTPHTSEKRVGVVDLGELSWAKASFGGYYVFTASIPAILDGGNVNMLCSKYPVLSSFAQADKSISNIHWSSANTITIRDSEYNDATNTAFKEAMKGVMLNYELATPIVVPHSERKMYFPSFKGGTESIVADGDSAPLRADIGYPLDLRSLFPSTQSEE